MDRLNETSSVLGIMAPAMGVHPFTAYVELCRTVGKLALFAYAKRVPSLPAYDHDNLEPIFRRVHTEIQKILKSIPEGKRLRQPFVWEGDIMQAELKPAWFAAGVEWFIGVDRGRGTLNDAECRRLLSKANNFLWKFGSNDENIYKLGALSLDLDAVTNRIPELPPDLYWTYWRVRKEESHPLYQAIKRTSTIAAFMRDQNNPSFQPKKYAQTHLFPVVRNRETGETTELGLSLFGVIR
jgi:type VI secretion system protein ImpJ